MSLLEEVQAGHVVDEMEAQLLSAMRLFDTYPAIVLQRAQSADESTVGYRCSIPLYASDPRKAGQLLATVDGDGDTAALAISAAVIAAASRRS